GVLRITGMSSSAARTRDWVVAGLSNVGVAPSVQFVSAFLQTERGWRPAAFAALTIRLGALAIGGNPVAGRPGGKMSAVPTDSATPTSLLLAWGRGDATALDRLVPLVYDELHRIARRYMAGEPAGHTLQTSALVNEAYLRLIDIKQVQWQNRAHFLAMAARTMRRILVDSARARRNQRRGGDVVKVSLDDAIAVASDRRQDLVALDEALERLQAVHPRQADVVELRFFGGLTLEETA